LKVFVAFGYNDRDRWIPDFIFPLVRAFGGEVLSGEDVQGQQITDEIRRRIETSDGLIALRTRRGDPDSVGTYRTHRWVEDELAYAIAHNVRVVEVREELVDSQGGIAGDRQWITYREGERDRLLIELTKLLGVWSRAVTVNIQLLPPELVEEIRSQLRAPGFSCTYKLLEGSRESIAQEGQVRPIKGGIFLQTPPLPPQSLIQVCIEAAGKRWTSDYETLDSVGISLKAD
jgi:hypothetical protein